MPELSSTTRIVQSSDCAYQLIAEKMVIVYPRERTIHRLDEVGTAIWQFLERHHTIDEIVDFVIGEYEIDRATASGDVNEFVSELIGKKLLSLV
ncbi:MAG: hypothetical protein A2W05_10900 [Candidatus Schekmanbacteria bacterium RBG_16_38_10]|uniref:Pyrroloquinoline quinone biosynthesis protein PqqD n=1 Tax=Candidatus Schekmanbacteria bacterium RBG_16_38_10 TaxID=1817879 RepID=A0A1F7RPS7_9BACT|nr:MAG: hypothetical protein A2W05_10900 [Candidatus Schekmanbacteria bacterium RBG_16_38_10]